MNLKIEIELAFEDGQELLEDILVDIADVIKKHDYGNINDEDSYVRSFIRVKRLEDEEVILVVIPIQDEEEVVNDTSS